MARKNRKSLFAILLLLLLLMLFLAAVLSRHLLGLTVVGRGARLPPAPLAPGRTTTPVSDTRISVGGETVGAPTTNTTASSTNQAEAVSSKVSGPGDAAAGSGLPGSSMCRQYSEPIHQRERFPHPAIQHASVRPDGVVFSLYPAPPERSGTSGGNKP